MPLEREQIRSFLVWDGPGIGGTDDAGGPLARGAEAVRANVDAWDVAILLRVAGGFITSDGRFGSRVGSLFILFRELASAFSSSSSELVGPFAIDEVLGVVEPRRAAIGRAWGRSVREAVDRSRVATKGSDISPLSV